jgi:hypothetical protein
MYASTGVSENYVYAMYAAVFVAAVGFVLAVVGLATGK